MEPERPSPSPDARRPDWVLHLLAGLQRGAEARLQDGIEYILGRDESCDLVLWDESVASRHLSLLAHPGSIRAQALEQPIHLAGRQLVPGESIELDIATGLRLGDVALAVGRPDTRWSDLTIPDPAAVAASPREEPDAREPEQPDLPAASPVAEAGPSVPPEGTLEDSDRPNPAKPWWGSGRGLVAASVLLVPILAGLGWFALAPRQVPVAGASPATDRTTMERAQDLVERLGLGPVEMERRPDGVLILRGYCETRAKRDELTAAAEAAGLPLVNRLWPEDGVRRILAETLDRLGGGHLDYEYLGAGEVRVHGLLRSGLSAEEVERSLRNDVPGIRNLVMDAQELGPFLEDLREALRDGDLDRKLSIHSEDPPITLKGRLNTRDMEVWDRLRKQLAERYPRLPPLVSEVMHDPRERRLAEASGQPAAEAETPGHVAWPAIRVRGILIGANDIAYAVLDNGEQVMRGDLIADRYRVEEIRFDRVIARLGEERHVFRVGVDTR
ncbi:type III secretion system inner membrane ring subunit SctD [Imhoffiella purpurea]|uniref:EscD/YscD/HrpQ family type III secretion system inner membrane ring protein n=1 Tax=Imhoffiella purpurea TaxID=1249627 RepID=W9VHY5_9GAMM|nr:type III secretion system inner membrane ring subunit SctD [Imhoffiella purpurea]EXJ15662.1 hypothetical protein D779_1169 [Imhoffiella purpurea]